MENCSGEWKSFQADKINIIERRAKGDLIGKRLGTHRFQRAGMAMRPHCFQAISDESPYAGCDAYPGVFSSAPAQRQEIFPKSLLNAYSAPAPFPLRSARPAS